MHEKTKDNILQKIQSAAIKKTAEILTLSTLLFMPAEFKATSHAIYNTTGTHTQSNETAAMAECELLLPTIEDAYNKLLSLNSTTQPPKQINRLALPKNNENIKVNFTFDTTPAQKNLLDKAILEFNNIFTVINPNYFFEANYSPSSSDLTNMYNITVKSVEVFEEDNILGLATSICKDLANEIDGKELYSHQIEIKESVLTNSDKLLTVFKHEIMHLLGAEDDYSQSNTIMRQLDINNNITHLSKTDINFLSSLYYNKNNAYSENDIKNFADTYEMNNAFIWLKQQQKHQQEFCLENLKKHIDSLPEEALLEQILQSFSQKYSHLDLYQFAQGILSSHNKNNNLPLSNFGELLQQDMNASIHKFIQSTEDTIMIHNYRDIDNSQQTQLYHFERILNDITKYENILGNENTAYIAINNYILQVEYSTNENGKVNFAPTHLYKQLNLSKEDYASSLTTNQDNFKLLYATDFQIAK